MRAPARLVAACGSHAIERVRPRCLVVSLLIATGCMPTTPHVLPSRGPLLGESTAPGPRDPSRTSPAQIGGVPIDVGPGVALSTPPSGAPVPVLGPQPAPEREGPAGTREEPVYVTVPPEPPPPVFQPPPPPPP